MTSEPFPTYWDRPEMCKPADCIQSSEFTWSESPKFEAKGPLDMTLLMQHYYGRAWRVAKRTFDNEVASITNLESAYIERQCVMKAKIHRQKLVMASQIEKPRYIYPKYVDMIYCVTDKGMVEWEPARMPSSSEFMWPWSTWVGLRRKEEEKEPHNMMLLMQHAYVRCPLAGCWEIRKLPPTSTEEEVPASRPEYFERRYVPKNYVSKNKKDSPRRFILPRFKNIPARTDSNFRPIGKGMTVTEAN